MEQSEDTRCRRLDMITAKALFLVHFGTERETLSPKQTALGGKWLWETGWFKDGGPKARMPTTNPGSINRPSP